MDLIVELAKLPEKTWEYAQATETRVSLGQNESLKVINALRSFGHCPSYQGYRTPSLYPESHLFASIYRTASGTNLI